MFSFDVAAFEALETEPERVTMLYATMDKYVETYYPNIAKKQALTESEKSSIESLAQQLPARINTVADTEHRNLVCKTLQLLVHHLGDFPVSPKFMSFFRTLFMGTVELQQGIYESTIRSLFMSTHFCQLFLNQNGLLTVFIGSIEANSAERLALSYGLFMTPVFVSAMTEGHFFPVINHILSTIRLSQMEPAFLFKLMHYLVLIIHETGFASDLAGIGFFDDFNQFFVSFDVSLVMKMYDLLIMSRETRKTDYDIVKFVCQLYHMEAFGIDKMCELLRYIREHKDAYLESPQHFMPEKWYDERVLTEKSLFCEYTALLKDCLIRSPFTINLSVKKIVDAIQPPIREEVLYRDVMGFFRSVLEEKQGTVDEFNHSIFLKRCVIEPPADVVLDLLEKYGDELLQLLSLILQRLRWYSHNLMERLVTICLMDERYEDIIKKLLYIHFSPSILMYFVKKLDDSDRFSLLQQILPDDPRKTVECFQTIGGFDLTPQLLMEPKACECILKFVSIVGNLDCFFDEWLLAQDSECPIFKLTREVISEYVFKGDVLVIPSLLPLSLYPLTRCSEYHFYLIGRYSLPVYERLNIGYDRIPFLTEIAGRYFSPTSFMKCVKLHPKLAMTMIADPAIPFVLFEFTPNRVSFLDLSHYFVCSFGFFMRVEGFGGPDYPFITCNGTKFFISGNKITDGAALAVELQLRIWHQIFFVFNKGPKTVTMYVDLHNVYTMKATSLQIDCIGDRRRPPENLFYVQSQIVLLQSPMSPEQMLQYGLGGRVDGMLPLSPKGSFRFVPIHSVKHICNDTAFQCRVFELFDNGDDTYRKELLSVISTIPLVLEKENTKGYFERFLFSLEKCKEYHLDYLSCYVQAISRVSEVNQRTEFLASLLMSWEILSKMSINDFVEFQYEVLKELLHLEIDWVLMANRHIFLFYWQVMWYFNEDLVTDSISVLLNFVVECLNPKDLVELVDIALISGMWNYDIDVTTWDCIPSLYSSFGQSHKMQEKIVSLVNGKTNIQQLSLFSIDRLISLSLSENYTLAKTTFLIFLQVHKESAYLSDNVYLVSLLLRRFYAEKEVFQAIVSLITGQNYILGKDYTDLSVKKPCFIPFLLSFCVAVASSENADLINNVYRDSFLMLKDESGLVCDNTQLVYLRELFQGGTPLPMNGEQKLTDVSYQLPQCSKSDQKSIQENVNKSQESFAAILNKLVDSHCLPDPPPIDYLQFVSQLVIRWILDNTQTTRVKKVLDLLVCEGRPSIVSHVLCGVFSQMSLNWSKARFLESATKLFCWRQPEAFREVFNRLLALSEIPETMKELFNLLLDIVDYMPPEVFQKYLKILNDQVETRGLLQSQRTAEILVIAMIRANIYCEEPLLGILTEIVKNNASDNITSCEGDISTWQVAEKPVVLRVRSVSQGKFEDFSALNTRMQREFNSLFTTLFNSVTGYVLKFVTTMRLAYKRANAMLRDKEKRNAVILYNHRRFGCVFGSDANSFRLAPFAGPDECNLVLLPSDMVIDQPKWKLAGSERFVEDEHTPFMNMKPISRISKRHPVNDDEMLFCNSDVFPSPSPLMLMFAETFPDASDLKESCILVRLGLRVPCVMFTCGSIWRVLTKARISDAGLLELFPFDVSQNMDAALKEAVLMNEFGSFSLFCGHFVLNIPIDSVYYARKYVYASIANAYEVFSITSGSFIVQFTRPTFIIQPVKLLGRICDADWMNMKVSTFRYLMHLNSLANRSVNDLCAYPIMPRILVNYKDKENLIKRNMSQPIDIAGDADPEHKMILKCFTVQHYHHAENVSHPLYVSGALSRLQPYCRGLWELNDGWDAGDRNFVSVESGMSIGSKTMYEFPPELFALPESFINVNNFVLPNGKRLDMTFPSWCKDAYQFIEFQRELLESSEVRANLHSWLDIMFGVDNFGEGAEKSWNVFNAMSYYDPTANLTPEEAAHKHQWMLSCGQVPFVIRTTRFEEVEPLPEYDMTFCELKSREAQSGKENEFVRVFKYDQSITVTSETTRITKYLDCLANVVDVFVSDSRRLIIVTVSTDTVMVFSFMKNVLQCKATRAMESPKFTVLLESQMLCYTACLRKIVVWSCANEAIVNVIDLPNVTAMNVCRDRACLFAASGTTIYQYSLNGVLLRKVDVEAIVTCIESFGFEMFHAGLMFVAGTVRGDALIVELVRETSQMVVVSQTKMGHGPVRRIDMQLQDGVVNITT